MPPQKPQQPQRPVLTLPTTKTTPAHNLSAYSILLYGREKAGKTTLVAEFPDVLFLSVEPGTKNLSVFAVFPKTWTEFVGYIGLLEREPKRYANVAVDTVDIAFDMCEAHVCAQLGINHPSEGDYGQAWSAVKKEFSKQMARLAAMPRGLIFISHATHKEIKGRVRGGAQVVRDMVQPTMSGQARRVIEPMVDIWAYYEFDAQNQRQLYIQGADDYSAGNRTKDRFLVPGAKPVRQHTMIPMGSSSREAYENFVRAFNNELPDATVVDTRPSAPRSPERRHLVRK